AFFGKLDPVGADEEVHHAVAAEIDDGDAAADDGERRDDAVFAAADGLAVAVESADGFELRIEDDDLGLAVAIEIGKRRRSAVGNDAFFQYAGEISDGVRVVGILAVCAEDEDLVAVRADDFFFAV